MPSKVDICNLALLRLGAMPIVSLDENSKGAVALNSIFDNVVDLVLRDHPWNFATRRATLARLTETPVFGYAYAYQLPEDNLRMLGLVDLDTGLINPTLEYEIEGKKLLTSQASATIKYVGRVTDVTQFDARFVSVLASRLAAEIALHIVKTPAAKTQMMNEYMFELATARSIDAQENPPAIYQEDSWMDARL